MEKKYRIEANSITGKHGQTFRKGAEVPHSHLINHDDHVAARHITEIAPEAPAKAPVAEIKAPIVKETKKANELTAAGK